MLADLCPKISFELRVSVYTKDTDDWKKECQLKPADVGAVPMYLVFQPASVD